MIFYFTGTGNSLYAAYRIAEAQSDRVLSIAKLMDLRQDSYRYELRENELLGFVFPVFAWGPPQIVVEFIERLEVSEKPEEGVKAGSARDPYVFSLCTCGNEEGNTSQIMRKALSKRGVVLDGAFSVRMPNNYIVGFDVDPKDLEVAKLKAADLLLSEINKTIGLKKRNVNLTIPGRLPAVRTALINPLFNTFALNTRHFRVDDSCTSCGICEKICPVHSIKVADGEKPVWGKDCTQCLGCINRCPAHAIQFGKRTGKKGRYHHPDLDRMEREVNAHETAE